MSPDERKTLRAYDADNPYLRESDVSLLRAMAKYIEDLKALAVTNPELAKKAGSRYAVSIRRHHKKRETKKAYRDVGLSRCLAMRF